MDGIKIKKANWKYTSICFFYLSKVSLVGFGSFVAGLQKGKSGKVPGTDKTYVKPAHYAPKFSVSGSLVTEVADKIKA